MRVRTCGWLVLAWGLLLGTASALYGDTIIMKDGTYYEGIIVEIRNGQVQADIAGRRMTLEMPDIESMNFDTPHLVSTGTDAVMDHFLTRIDAQEIVENFAELEETAEELRTLISQVERYWEAREPIASNERQGWEAARDQFRRPLSRYQELLNDVYFHVLARVDEYNAIAHDAGEIYVGVRGIFNVGSPLLPDGMGQLSLRKYVPAAWFDTIYFEGYNVGYTEAYMKITGDYPEN